MNPVQASTGAIPKSISFDKNTFDSSSGGGEDGNKKLRDRNSFFRSFKLPKIVKQGGGGNNSPKTGRGSLPGSPSVNPTNDAIDNIDGLRRTASDETTDDILAKYRKKSDSVPDSSQASDLLVNEDIPDERLSIDPQNVESSFAFQDAKRKLRMMLSEADLTVNFCRNNSNKNSNNNGNSNEIVYLLRLMLAEAHNLQVSA